jgi:protease I
MAGKALFITSNTGIEHDELIKPFEFLQSKGIEAIHAAIEQSEVQTVKHDKTLGPTYTPLTSLDKIDPADYDILVIPGGTVNADQLRIDKCKTNYSILYRSRKTHCSHLSCALY